MAKWFRKVSSVWHGGLASVKGLSGWDCARATWRKASGSWTKIGSTCVQAFGAIDDIHANRSFGTASVTVKLYVGVDGDVRTYYQYNTEGYILADSVQWTYHSIPNAEAAFFECRVDEASGSPDPISSFAGSSDATGTWLPISENREWILIQGGSLVGSVEVWVDLEIQEIGNAGNGKTTLIRMSATINPP